MLKRFSISLEEDLLVDFDDYIRERHYNNRSEAIRDLIRESLVELEWETGDEEVVGTITLIYSHTTRELADKLTDFQHQAHHAIISTLHVHLDEHNCLEVMVVRGKSNLIREISERLISTKGVKHGKLTMTSVGDKLA